MKTNNPTVVLSIETDEFFARNLYSGYGEIASNLKSLVDKLQERAKQQKNIESIEDMQKILDSYPEYKKESANVYKHVDMMSIIGEEVDKRKLLALSKLEQSIAVSNSKEEHFTKIKELIKDPSYDPYDKLRIVLLFALRYEGDPKVETLKFDLNAENIPNVSLLDLLLKFSGKEKRKHGFLGTAGGLLDKASKAFLNAFKNIPNVFTQHKSLTCLIAESLLNGALKEVDYPSTTGETLEGCPESVIIFIVGGSTYQEAREIAELSKRCPISLCSTNIINSRIYLAELTYHGILSGQILPNSIPISSSKFEDIKFQQHFNYV